MFFVLPGRGIVEGDAIPYQTWAAEKRKQNFENRVKPNPSTAIWATPK